MGLRLPPKLRQFIRGLIAEDERPKRSKTASTLKRTHGTIIIDPTRIDALGNFICRYIPQGLGNITFAESFDRYTDPAELADRWDNVTRTSNITFEAGFGGLGKSIRSVDTEGKLGLLLGKYIPPSPVVFVRFHYKDNSGGYNMFEGIPSFMGDGELHTYQRSSGIDYKAPDGSLIRVADIPKGEWVEIAFLVDMNAGKFKAWVNGEYKGEYDVTTSGTYINYIRFRSNFASATEDYQLDNIQVIIPASVKHEIAGDILLEDRSKIGWSDVAIYRAGADLLKIDDALEVAGKITADSGMDVPEDQIINFGGGQGKVYSDGTHFRVGHGSLGVYIRGGTHVWIYEAPGAYEIMLGDYGNPDGVIRIRTAGRATADNPLTNSHPLRFVGSYWDGAATRVRFGRMFLRMLSTTPTAEFAFQTPEGTDVMAIGDEECKLWKNLRILKDDAKITMGSAEDVALYRAGADLLKTDDDFDARSLRIGGTEVITSGRVIQNVYDVYVINNVKLGGAIIHGESIFRNGMKLVEAEKVGLKVKGIAILNPEGELVAVITDKGDLLIKGRVRSLEEAD